MVGFAIGLIETRGLVPIIAAADAAAKAADVQLEGCERIGGGLVVLRFRGDVASVQAAVLAAEQAARRLGEVVSVHVIPGPHPDLMQMLDGGDDAEAKASPVPRAETQSSAAEKAELTLEQIRALPVTRLRQLARRTPGIGLKGRQISRANRQSLIAELARVLEQGNGGKAGA
ncbi:MAG: BMC domain-containing protein [Candidatus Latescibacteria bacterium]|nr:BMC domain-containing protein [Candidatus Latescibacterota bacterium]